MREIPLAMTAFLATRFMLCRPPEIDNIIRGVTTFDAALEGTLALDLITNVRSS